jgi:hypothetical protein
MASYRCTFPNCFFFIRCTRMKNFLQQHPVLFAQFFDVFHFSVAVGCTPMNCTPLQKEQQKVVLIGCVAKDRSQGDLTQSQRNRGGHPTVHIILILFSTT